MTLNLFLSDNSHDSTATMADYSIVTRETVVGDLRPLLIIINDLQKSCCFTLYLLRHFVIANNLVF